jgi:hypothetical protein
MEFLHELRSLALHQAPFHQIHKEPEQHRIRRLGNIPQVPHLVMMLKLAWSCQSCKFKVPCLTPMGHREVSRGWIEPSWDPRDEIKQRLIRVRMMIDTAKAKIGPPTE